MISGEVSDRLLVSVSMIFGERYHTQKRPSPQLEFQMRCFRDIACDDGSAGATSMSLHLVMPESAGLFHAVRLPTKNDDVLQTMVTLC